MNLNQKYFDLLLTKKDLATESLVLKNESNNSKLIPFSICSTKDEKEFNLYKYQDLKVLKETLQRTNLKILKMQAGLGSSVKRDDLVDGRLSAKGVDLKLEYKNDMTSIARIHLLIMQELNSRNIYNSIKFQSLVNDETKDDIEKISEGFNTLESIEQLKMPTIDESGTLTKERMAPCGHGFVGIYEIVDAIINETDEVVCIGNGEDLNSTVDEKIISLIVDKKIPLLMITTDKTALDKKGGQLAIVKEDIPYITIVEKAQAEASDQLAYFEALGLREGEKRGLFNTNIVVINKKALREVINKSIKDFSIDIFLKNIAPNVIQNIKEQDSKKFTQLESALGSVVLNTDRYFRESFGQQILSVLNLSEDDRSRFFLPIKTRDDYEFIKSNYSFDEMTLKLIKTK